MAYRRLVHLEHLFSKGGCSLPSNFINIQFRNLCSVTPNLLEKYTTEDNTKVDAGEKNSYVTSKKSCSPSAKRQANLIKKLHRENKALYGQLVETKKDKVKRTKSEASTRKVKEKVEGLWLSFDEEEAKNKKTTKKKRNLYNSVVLPKSDSILLEHASVSINKGRAKPGNDVDDDNVIQDNAKEKTDSYSGRRAHKEAEIEWALRHSPTKVKLIELSPLSSSFSSQDHDRNGVVAVDNSQGSKLIEKAVQKPQGNPNSANSNLFLLPFDNPSRIQGEGPESNYEASKSSEDYKNKEGEMIITSFPYPFSRRPVETPSGSVNGIGEVDQSPEKSPASLTSQRLPSVSKILSATMPEEQARALKRWEEKMIAQMGEEGFRHYKESILKNGKLLHGNIESYLRGTPLEDISVAEPNQGHWKSLNSILSSVDGVSVLESHVVHPELEYCGVIDCVAEFRNRLVLIDWKTSQKPKPFVSMTYDTPLQIAAYIGAINYDPRYSMRVNEGLIVVAYQDGRMCQTFSLSSLDLNKYWKLWLERLKLFRSINANL